MDEVDYDVSLENNAFRGWVLVDRVTTAEMYKVEVNGIDILVPPEMFFEKEFGAAILKDSGEPLNYRANLLVFESNHAVLHCEPGCDEESEFCIFSPPRRKDEDGEYLEGSLKKLREAIDIVGILEGGLNAKPGVVAFHLIEYFDRLFHLDAIALDFKAVEDAGAEIVPIESKLVSENDRISKALGVLNENGYHSKKKFFGSGWVCTNNQRVKIHFKTDEQLIQYVAETYEDA